MRIHESAERSSPKKNVPKSNQLPKRTRQLLCTILLHPITCEKPKISLKNGVHIKLHFGFFSETQ